MNKFVTSYALVLHMTASRIGTGVATRTQEWILMPDKSNGVEIRGEGRSKVSESKITTDHGKIQTWTEERGGWPARVKDSKSKNSSGILRIDYKGYSGGDTLERISWEEFFEGFEDNNLAFLYQDKTKDGEQSRFSKLIDRDSPEAKGH